MPKLTETFNDKAAQARVNGNGLHVVQPHEPLRGEPFPIPVNLPEILDLPVAPKAEPQPLKVALIGTAPSSRLLAPYNDPTWQIWACSPGNMNGLPRADRWFEIHGNLHWPENKHYGEPYIQFLRGLKIPLYMQDKRYCENAIPLPKDELVKEFGPYYFTSSFSWMMAMAMREGCKEMALYGIDMASRDEYILQRPGAYHFFNEADRRGVKVSAPYESDIMQPPGLYGYSEVTPFGRKVLARKQELTERLTAMRQERDQKVGQLNNSITYLEGALEDLDYWNSIWGGVQNNGAGQT